MAKRKVICKRCLKVMYLEEGDEGIHTCSIPIWVWDRHKTYPEVEQRSRWSQFLSSGNVNILLRKEDR